MYKAYSNIVRRKIMKRKYNLYQIDSFTKEKLTGNPAGVITNADGLTDSEMQKIARELNNSETAFIISSDSKVKKIPQISSIELNW